MKKLISTGSRQFWIVGRLLCTSTNSNDFVARNKRMKNNIIENTKVSRDHLTPEIALRLITTECRLFHEPMTEDNCNIFTNDPFWGFYWPGGQALSRFILDNPHIVSSKSVLDVGSGSGACSIAAKKCGAKYSIANDIDEVAAIAAEINAKLNGAQIQTTTENLIGSACNEDVILLGDIFYDLEIADILYPWLRRLAKQGKIIYIGDPGRHGLTKQHKTFLNKITTYELSENCCIENNGFKFVNVWQYM